MGPLSGLPGLVSNRIGEPHGFFIVSPGHPRASPDRPGSLPPGSEYHRDNTSVKCVYIRTGTLDETNAKTLTSLRPPAGRQVENSTAIYYNGLVRQPGR